MRKWEIDETDHLITLTEPHLSLFDVRDKLYHNRTKREQIFQQITAEMQKVMPDVTTDEVKRKIKSLRDSYRREKNLLDRSKRSGAGAADVYRSNFPFFDRLHFTAIHGEARTTESNIKNQSLSGESSCTQTPPQISESTEDERSLAINTLLSIRQHLSESTRNVTRDERFIEYVRNSLMDIEDVAVLGEVKSEIMASLDKGLQRQWEIRSQSGSSTRAPMSSPRTSSPAPSTTSSSSWAKTAHPSRLSSPLSSPPQVCLDHLANLLPTPSPSADSNQSPRFYPQYSPSPPLDPNFPIPSSISSSCSSSRYSQHPHMPSSSPLYPQKVRLISNSPKPGPSSTSSSPLYPQKVRLISNSPKTGPSSTSSSPLYPQKVYLTPNPKPASLSKSSSPSYPHSQLSCIPNSAPSNVPIEPIPPNLEENVPISSSNPLPQNPSYQIPPGCEVFRLRDQNLVLSVEDLESILGFKDNQ